MITGRAVALALTGLLLPAGGCGVVGFDVEEPIPEQTVSGSPNPLATLLPGLFSLPFRIDIEERTRAQGTGPARSAHLKSITLSITAPAAGTFDFLDSLTVSLQASDGSIPEIEVARLDMVPRGQRRISLGVNATIDILPYVKRGSTMKASARGRMPQQEVKFDGKVVVHVKV